MEVGMRRIRVLRKAMGLTELELSRRARVHPSDVSGIELGRRIPGPGSTVLKRLARVLKWTGDPIALLDEIEEEVPPAAND
jgi:transcriptional regulator with XRE-family HTH domain